MQRSGGEDVRVVLDAFRHIVKALRVTSDGSKGRGVSPAALFALQRIAETPGASVNDIASLTFTHQSSVSVVIDRLVRDGFVAKQAAPEDRRRCRLQITVKGRRVIDRAPMAGQERLIDVIQALPASERRSLARSLGRVARAIAPAAGVGAPPMFFEESAGAARKREATRQPRAGGARPLPHA